MWVGHVTYVILLILMTAVGRRVHSLWVRKLSIREFISYKVMLINKVRSGGVRSLTHGSWALDYEQPN